MTPDEEVAALIAETRTGLKTAVIATERLVSVAPEANREDCWQIHLCVDWVSRHFEAAVLRLRR